MTVRVVFSSAIWVKQRAGGISRYYLELISGLVKHRTFKPVVVAPLYLTDGLRRADVRRGVLLSRDPGYATARLLRATGRVADAVARLASRGIWHSTYLDVPAGSSPFVVTAFDLIHEEFPHLFDNSAEVLNRKRRLYRLADHIIAISDHTRTRLIDMYGRSPDSITTVPLGVDRNVFHRPDIESEREGVLYVGDRKGYKNFERLLTAASMVDSARIVAFGGGPFTNTELARIESLGLSGRVTHRWGSDEMLAEAYRRAKLLVVTSLSEGFGLPVIEAMASGCPTLVANAGALPEVSGGASATFDPYDVEDLAGGLWTLLNDTNVTQRLSSLGDVRAREFSWERTVSGTVGVYHQLLGLEL